MSSTRDVGTIVMSALGMVSSLGPDMANSCAAARAGITRARPLRVLNFSGDRLWGKQPVVGHGVPLAEGFKGLGKLVTLGALALEDFVRRIAILKLEPDRTGMYINLSDKYFEEVHAQEEQNGENPSTAWREETGGLIPRLTTLCNWSISSVNQCLFYGGHAGMAQAMMQAIRHIRSGVLDRCIVGGIDSYLEAESLLASARLGALKTAANEIGFMPGEAAAFLLLQKREISDDNDRPTIASLEAATIAEEGRDWFSDPPSQGAGLYEAIRNCLSGVNGEEYRTAQFIGDLNGDVCRAMEWGYTLVRMTKLFGANCRPLWTPSQSFGETGAAAGAISCCVAIKALERDYLKTNNVLIWLSSENGAKGALRIRSWDAMQT